MSESGAGSGQVQINNEVGGSFQVNYGSGGNVQLSGFSAVPEPGSAGIIVLAGIALLAPQTTLRMRRN